MTNLEARPFRNAALAIGLFTSSFWVVTELLRAAIPPHLPTQSPLVLLLQCALAATLAIVAAGTGMIVTRSAPRAPLSRRGASVSAGLGAGAAMWLFVDRLPLR